MSVLESTHPVLRCIIWLGVLAAMLSGATAGINAQQLEWEAFGGQLLGGEVQALAADASGRAWAATYHAGVFRSTDGGRTWLAPEDDGRITRLENVLAFDTGGVVLARTFSGSFRSTDAGITWDSIGPAGALAIDQAMGGAYVITTMGTFFSADRGATWERRSNRRPVNFIRRAVAHDGVVWVAGPSMVVRSLDNGMSWDTLATTLGEGPAANVGSFLRADDGSLTLGGLMMRPLRSIDSGRTWTPLVDGLDTGVTSVQIWQAPNGGLFTTDDDSHTTGPLYLLADAAGAWTLIEDSLGRQPSAMLSLGDSVVLAAFRYRGIERSTDGGATFALSSDGLTANNEIPALGVDPNGRVWASTYGTVHRFDDQSGAFEFLDVVRTQQSMQALALGSDGWVIVGALQSLDGGDTWRAEIDGLEHFGLWLVDVAFDQFRGRAVAATLTGTYVMGRHDEEWGIPRLGGITMEAVAAHPNGMLFAGGEQFLMYRSADGGVSWEQASTGLEAAQPTITYDIAVDRNGNLLAAMSNGVFGSTDLGTSWHRLPVGTDTTAPFQAILATSHGPIIAVTSGVLTGVRFPTAIYLSTDDGQSWIEQESVPADGIATLALDSAGHVYLGAPGGRVFRSVRTTSAVAAAETATDELQIIPIPADDHLRIEYASTGAVVIRVIDMLGRERVRLERNEVGAAHRSAHLDVSALASGTYLVRIERSDGTSQSRPIIIR